MIVNNVPVTPIYALWHIKMCATHVSQLLIIILRYINGFFYRSCKSTHNVEDNAINRTWQVSFRSSGTLNRNSSHSSSLGRSLWHVSADTASQSRSDVTTRPPISRQLCRESITWWYNTNDWLSIHYYEVGNPTYSLKYRLNWIIRNERRGDVNDNLRRGAFDAGRTH